MAHIITTFRRLNSSFAFISKNRRTGGFCSDASAARLHVHQHENQYFYIGVSWSPKRMDAMQLAQCDNKDARCSGIAEFKNLFRFDPAKSLFVGVERECFLASKDGVAIEPKAPEVILGLTEDEPGCFGGYRWYLPQMYAYELSACQLETRVGPCKISEVYSNLVRCENILTGQEKQIGFKRLFTEVAPADMPLDVYPDPTGRYAKITAAMPREVLLAACRVIGTHVHIGMPDHESALAVYNRVVPHCGILCDEGDGSNGERLNIYRVVAPDCDPKPYQDWEHFHRVALERGFAEDPRKCWTLIRISKHGTIEFRMFGATPSIEKVAEWAERCHTLCLKAMP